MDISTHRFVNPHEICRQTNLPMKFYLPDELEGNPYHLFFWMLARFKFIDTGGEVLYTYLNVRNNYLCETALAALPSRFIRELTVYAEYEYVPLPAMIWDNGLIHEPWMYEYIRSLYKPLWEKYTMQKGKYTYICRHKDLKSRVILNESELRDPLKRLGFSFYFMEDLSFKEQIALFATSEIILSPHGAALSFGIFSAPDSVMIEIQSSAGFENSKYFYDLCVKCSLHWFLFSDVESIGENYRVDLNSLLKSLTHIIGIRQS